MSRTVWKFILIPDEIITITGGDPKVVHVDTDPATPTQDRDLRQLANWPSAWVELDPDGEDRLLLTFIGTGHEVPEDSRHVGSCKTPVGLMWHVYVLELR